MIYCVVPEALADDLLDKLTDYYASDPNVTVIVDRRHASRREAGSSGGGKREVRDRRRAEDPGRAAAARDGVNPRRLVLHVDGGARGNPGPAAIGVVIADQDGEVIDELAERIGVATNNVAEYRALLRGVARAAELGATELELINDSELVAKQLTGAYKVKHPAMKPLYEQAQAALAGFERWQIRSVPRAQNARRRRARQRGARRAALSFGEPESRRWTPPGR